MSTLEQLLPPPAQVRRALVALGWCAGATVVVLGVVVVASFDAGVEAGELLRDPMAVLEAPFWVGLVSNLGVLLWAASAVLAAFLAVVAHRAAVDRAATDRAVTDRGAADGGAPASWPFYAAIAALAGWLLLDDALLVHEQVLPLYLGLPGELAFLVSALGTAAFVVVFRRGILTGDWLVLLAALGLLVGSLGVDQLHDLHLLGRLGLPATGAGQLLLEDGLKLAGSFAWFAWVWLCGLGLFARVRGGTPGDPR